VLSPAFTSRLLPLTLGFLLLCSLAVPVRFLAFARPLGQLVTALAAPVSHPFAAFSRWILPAESGPAVDVRVKELEARLEETERELRRIQQENRRLVQSLEEVNVLAIVNTTPVRQIYAPVFASSSDLSSDIIRARAGTVEGVDLASVATAAGMQLLGRVVSVDDRTCDIQVITSKSAEPINCMIMIDATANGLACRLSPTGKGTLRGPVEDRRVSGTAQPVEPVPGQVVRLSDGRWPGGAQMLLVGKVVAVEPSPDNPLRRLVVVVPVIERLERVSEVVIRASAPAATPEGER
jgi:cell shape-determining protein MreC